MWLLSTNRAELKFFSSPEAVTGGYAILSHTWGNYEETFQDVMAFRTRCEKSSSLNPRDMVSSKIRQCCIIAEEHGYKWVWNDTCCIDKTNSSEVSEAINSMFHWYSCAEICYAVLEDVNTPPGSELDAPGSPFRTARWHTRGWTLQELIAPVRVLFLNKNWAILGDRVGLAPLLEEITAIRKNILTREFHFTTASVAQRMSWAANRRSTRVEDEAYCLLGLFQVSMPTIYGEGRGAFRRLQNEIMRERFDTTIFAWGRWATGKLEPIPLQDIYKSFPSHRDEVYLLARSPRSFNKTKGIRFTPDVKSPLQPYTASQWKNARSKEPEDSWRRTMGPFGRIELPRFQMTSHGVECYLPVFECQGITVAVLMCETTKGHIGLLLHPSNDSLMDPGRPRYDVGYGLRDLTSGPHKSYLARVVSLGNDFYNLTFNGISVRAEWRNIYISDAPQGRNKGDVQLSNCFPLNCLAPAPPFLIPNWLIGQLAELGLESRAPTIKSRPTADGAPLVASQSFTNVAGKETVRLILGTCDVDAEGNKGNADISHPVHWARVMILTRESWGNSSSYEHSCEDDHVANWPGMTRDFGDDRRTVRLSFVQSKITPDVTLVTHIELKGSAYDDLKGKAQVEFEPLEKGVEGAMEESIRTLTLTFPKPGGKRTTHPVTTVPSVAGSTTSSTPLDPSSRSSTPS